MISTKKMMQKDFPLFQSHLDLAHQYWKALLSEGDWAIDATCGNGQDALQLAQILGKGGGIIGIDIQEQAIAKTKSLVTSQAPLIEAHFFIQSHVSFPSLAYRYPIRLIVYNLGYLPGGNKKLTTLTSSTLDSISIALDLIIPGGVVSIACYPGHQEGAIEEQAIMDLASTLPPQQWNVCHHHFLNRKASPSLILIQKK